VDEPVIPEAPPLPSGGLPTGSSAPTIKVRSPTGSFVQLQAARLAWRDAATKVEAALEATARGLLDDFDDPEAATAVRAKLGDHADELTDALDVLLETVSLDPGHAAAKRAVLKLLDAYGRDVASDPVLAVLDASPYTSTKVGQTLTSSLAAVRSHLS
jgi:hypothetical protein